MFDRFGKCPICRKPFKSEACPHSYDYVIRVLQAARGKEELARDVKKIQRRTRRG